MLKEGIYENLITEQTAGEIRTAQEHQLMCKRKAIDQAEASKILADHLADVIRKRLEEKEGLKEQVAFVNNILAEYGLSESEIADNSNLLTEVMQLKEQAMQQHSRSETPRPKSGFRVSSLFTGGNSALSLGEEIRREIASADEIYFIVSFLKLSGVRLLINDLRQFCQQAGKQLRIITTTYCGVTEGKALEQLAELPNTEIRISYQTNVERLHAKAYLFVRHSGMNTAYIGSSNLSKSAQTDGLEWNMRVTSVENPHIIKTALATFDLYWNSPNFEDFSLGGMEKFNEELKLNRTKTTSKQTDFQRFNLLPHQKQILDKLKVEREEFHNSRNLIVAATGTGKTVISAFDYLEFCRSLSPQPRPRILFTAHREEILRQSLNTYRSVLQDANFGSLWVGCHTPHCSNDYDALFISIAMLNSRFDDLFAKLPADYYDYIVVDEAHHSQADSYRKIFDHFKPKLLIGLTATPERMDGRDLRPDFGGRISAEIRLPQALQAGLLTPFQYICVTDSTDLSDDSLWNGQRYIIERLANRLCSRERAQQIGQALHRYLANEYTCRALCFCVNKQHAQFTANELRKQGFLAEALTSDTPDNQRIELAKQLREGRLHYLCVVDIFNEGVDIPEVDTVLFLRPTDSLTIFLQQLGRGLRLSAGKSELTVLDFVGQVNRKYDFASKFKALSLKPEKSIRDQVAEGFAFLPMGCSIIMEQKAKEYVLDNIQRAIYNKNRLIKELNSYATLPSLTQFIENNGQDIRIIYKSNQCWTSLKRDAGRIDYPTDDWTRLLEKGMGNFIHYNTPSFLHFVANFLQGSNDYLNPANERLTLMLYYALAGQPIHKTPFSKMGLHNTVAQLRLPQYHYFKDELLELVNYNLAHLEISTRPLGTNILPHIELYGCYTRADVFTLLGCQTLTKTMQGTASGVFHLKEYGGVMLLFVTLNKSDKDFSPSTQYDDYVINKDFFHWQSRNSDRHNSKWGKIYTQQSEKQHKIVLFVREDKKDGFGNTTPFHCFGLVDYVSSQGDAPMNITWRLHEPVMARFLKVV